MTALPKACIIGWPVEHARSPLLHQYWLRTLGIAGSYERHAVEPGMTAAFIRSLRERGLAGCNVTIPLKEEAYRAVDARDAAAEAVGAVNTIWLEGGRTIATNTDVYGFMRHLDLSAPRWKAKDRPAVVLGAGGASRAIVHGLLTAGVGEVRLFNRTRDRAEIVARHFGARVTVGDWAERVAATRDAGLLVNTTSLGMAKTGPLDMPVERLPADGVVADIVYVPLETDLLAAARRRGLVAVDGLGMLMHQGVPGFERWFGMRPEVTDELRALLVADIEGR